MLLGCGSFRKGSDSSPNISGFCDKGLQEQIDKALALGTTNQAAASELWATIDRGMMEQVPLVPLFNPKQVTLVSRRVGHYEYSKATNTWAYMLSWVQ